ncbi:MAG TPA: helix-turn-helix domain-containing protein [Bdellovibrionota bacterium]|nr:helix-turn-helix domain-containing protein [Bdellovibrionota bacterium]
MVQEEERRETLGQFLKRHRELKGISLEEIASITKIGTPLLTALEGDQYERLPSKPFVKGYLKAYANCVGLDVTETLDRFQKTTAFPEAPEKPLAPTPTVENLVQPRPTWVRVTYWVVFALGILVVIILAQHFASGPKKLVVAPPPVAEKKVEETTLVQKGEEDVTTGKITQQLLIHTTKPVWMKVKLDNHPTYVQQLLGQRDINLSANNKIQVFFSDRSAINLTLNDKSITDLGTSSTPVLLEFSGD